MTNSAAFHDVLPALAGYVNTRKKLLNAGVELYELVPIQYGTSPSRLAGKIGKLRCMPSPLCSTEVRLHRYFNLILDRRRSTPRSV